MNINGFGKASEEMIKRFERHMGISLPADYKQFLREYNGGTAKGRYRTFFVDALNETIPLDALYGLGVDQAFDLVYWNGEYRDDLIPNSVIIGDDPGSGKIVLVMEPEMEGVYYWDHAFHFERSTEEENAYKIAGSFQVFLKELKSP